MGPLEPLQVPANPLDTIAAVFGGFLIFWDGQMFQAYVTAAGLESAISPRRPGAFLVSPKALTYPPASLKVITLQNNRQKGLCPGWGDPACLGPRGREKWELEWL